MQLLWHIFRWFCGGVVFSALQLLLTGNCRWTDLAVFSLLCIPLDAVNERMPWTFPLWLQAVLGGIVLIVSQLTAGLVFPRPPPASPVSSPSRRKPLPALKMPVGLPPAGISDRGDAQLLRQPERGDGDRHHSGGLHRPPDHRPAGGKGRQHFMPSKTRTPVQASARERGFSSPCAGPERRRWSGPACTRCRR